MNVCLLLSYSALCYLYLFIFLILSSFCCSVWGDLLPSLSSSSLILFSASSNLLLIPSRAFFSSSIIVLFSSMTSFGSFLFSILLLKICVHPFFSRVWWASLWPLLYHFELFMGRFCPISFSSFFSGFISLVCLEHIPFSPHFAYISVFVSMY